MSIAERIGVKRTGVGAKHPTAMLHLYIAETGKEYYRWNGPLRRRQIRRHQKICGNLAGKRQFELGLKAPDDFTLGAEQREKHRAPAVQIVNGRLESAVYRPAVFGRPG